MSSWMNDNRDCNPSATPAALCIIFFLVTQLATAGRTFTVRPTPHCQVHAFASVKLPSRPHVSSSLSSRQQRVIWAQTAPSDDLLSRLDELFERLNCSDDDDDDDDDKNSDENNNDTLPIMNELPKIRSLMFGENDGQTMSSSFRGKSNLLIQASPGAGKTTIVPLFILRQLLLSSSSSPNDRLPQILVVAPRRVAVRSAAQRMSSLLSLDNNKVGSGGRGGSDGGASGGTVGYIMRDEARVSPTKTCVTVVTDGVMLNMIRDNPTLDGIDCVILDEFHERGVLMDTCLALTREIQRTFRSNGGGDDGDYGNERLRIIVMSATLFENYEPEDSNDDGAELATNSSEPSTPAPRVSTKQRLLTVLGGEDDCGIVQSDGRQFDISIQYANDIARSWSSLSSPKSKRSSLKRIPPLGLMVKDRKLLIKAVSDIVETVALPQSPDRGDILVFVPGAAECRRVVSTLQERLPPSADVDVMALYGTMPKEEQDKVLYPRRHGQKLDQQRVIVSTPIAEASLTIPRVTCVVDSGLCREPRCDADTGIPRLVTTKISKASAKQRSGRAGREREGLCLRLYTESDYNEDLNEQSPPEILSCDLSSILLVLADWGVTSSAELLTETPFVDPPENESLDRATKLLLGIGALEIRDDNQQKSHYVLTTRGREIAQIPSHPRLAMCISRSLEEMKNKSTNDALERVAASIMVSCLLDDESFSSSASPNNDLIDTAAREVSNPKFISNIRRFSRRFENEASEVIELLLNDFDFADRVINSIGSVMLTGFADMIAERKGDASYDSSLYRLAAGKTCRLDGIRDAPSFVIAAQTNTGPDGISRIRSYAAVNRGELETIAVQRESVYAVPSQGYEVRAKREMAIGSLVLSTTPLPSPSQERTVLALTEAIDLLGGVKAAMSKFMPNSDKEELNELAARIKLDQELLKDESQAPEWPIYFDIYTSGKSGESVDDWYEKETLLELVEPWLPSVKSIKKLGFLDIMRSTLTVDQIRYLDETYPVKIDAPDGSKISVKYYNPDGTPPKAEAKLQQFFGVTESPTVGPMQKQAIPVTLSLLSPAGRPLAETVDLNFFWKEVYPSIRSEMRGRYPKHPWPEDPLNAVATRKTKKEVQKTGKGSKKI